MITNPNQRSMSSLGLAAILFLAATPSLQAQVQCTETNGVKFILPPNVDGGLDIKNSGGNIVLADDFYCNISGPISDIHLWGSWLNNVHGVVTNFWIGIYGDVPAVTNFSSAQITPSHPGALLWQQTFTAGQYAESPYAKGSESFYDPVIPNFIGSDTEAWYYCFYPTKPFVQQGTVVQPTNYWLAVSAKVADAAAGLFGWKTSIYPYHDAAVWGTIDAAGLPLGDWHSMTNIQTSQPINLALKLTTTTNPPPPPQGCVETNGVKYVQWPNLDAGFDVFNDGPWVLADDFTCTSPGPITDIHLWGSWLNDRVTNNLTFQLAIYDDAPGGPAGNFSHPGNLLWQEQFAPGQYDQSFWSFGQEKFLDPGPPAVIGPDSQVWYYCFYPTNRFVQQGSPFAAKTYWLAAYAQSPAGGNLFYGWKSTHQFQNDISVHAPWPGQFPTGNWMPTFDTNGSPLDLSFKITTATNSPPPVSCVETDGVKTIQWPNILGGYDVWNTPYVLADDFVCNFIGPVSDIHLWGSWLANNALTNTINFWLGIYDDVPIGPANSFSHPGTNLLWQQWFAPGQYAETIWTANAQESFLDPGPTNLIGSDSIVWYYCFNPTNPFEQMGTAAMRKTYWLAAYAQLPVGINQLYGWKTSTNVLHDISVHALWPGTAPMMNPGWTPTIYQSPAGGPPLPLDLAFKLTTPTNICGPIVIKYLSPTNVVLTWTSGYLQSSTNVAGPYTDVPGATSPYTNAAVTPPYKFYRLRCY
jgi:hypothetical protein